MITDVLMPQMGLEVSEATVLNVLASVGDEVTESAPLIELETDKATTEVVAPRAGFVVSIEVAVEDVVQVGSLLARLGDSADESANGSPPKPLAGDDSAAAPQGAGAPAAPSPPAPAGRRRVAPVARRAAAALGVKLDALVGSGPRGRITLADVERAAESVDRAPAAYPGPAPAGAPASRSPEGASAERERSEQPPLSRLHRTMARRMTASQQIPQYQLQRDVDASHLLAQKEAQTVATGSGPRPNLNDLLIQAIAEMVVRHEQLATVYEDEPEPHLRRHDNVGVGLAVATERGLVVPVIERVESAGLAEIARRRKRLVAAARDGSLAQHEMGGAAITLSNLGAFGVDRFTAMLNPGESAIVAVGRTIDQVVARGRAIVVVPTLTVTITFDHRAIDGAVGGAALAELADLLEGGMTWRP